MSGLWRSRPWASRLVSLADTIATSSSFGARRGEEVDPNQEMIGIGAANLAAGLLQGFAVSTSGSRTAVVEQAGAKSQLASLVGAGIVVALLLFFNSLLADLPQSALAAVLIAAALVPARPRGPGSLLPGPEERPGPLRCRQPGRDRARRPARDRHRHRSCRAPLLPPQLAAPWRRPRRSEGSGRAGTASSATLMPGRSPGSSSTAGRLHSSSPTARPSAPRSAMPSRNATPRGLSSNARR